jgi:hypothetical protein
MVRQIVVDRPLLHVGCTLGEGYLTLTAPPWILKLDTGPVYDPDTSILHFVDIDECKVSIHSDLALPVQAPKTPKILHYNTVSLELQVEQFDEKVGCLALRRDGPGVMMHPFLSLPLTHPIAGRRGGARLRAVRGKLDDEIRLSTASCRISEIHEVQRRCLR